MTHISELVTKARAGASAYPRCSGEQALVYSCEDVAHDNHPTRMLGRAQAVDLVGDICIHENVDVPFVEFARRRARCTASFEPFTRTVIFHGSRPALSHVVHELAHVVSGSGNHDLDFRVTLVRIARRWAGIQYASLLHHLFAGVGLPMDPWSTQ